MTEPPEQPETPPPSQPSPNQPQPGWGQQGWGLPGPGQQPPYPQQGMGAPQQFPSAGFPARASLGPLTPDQERQSAKWTHLGPALIWWIGGVLTCGLATLLAFVPPLVILNGSGQRSAWVRANAVNALNFQLSLLIYNIGLMVFSVVFGVMTFGLGWIIALPIELVFWIGFGILMFMAASAAGRGQLYQYPLTIQMVH